MTQQTSTQTWNGYTACGNIQAAELASQIADIIAFRPDEFDMDAYESEGECGTTRCIAGWAGALSEDGLYDISASSAPSWVWVFRQAKHLGITSQSATVLFYSECSSHVLEAVLRSIAKHHENNDTDIDIAELEEMFSEAEED